MPSARLRRIFSAAFLLLAAPLPAFANFSISGDSAQPSAYTPTYSAAATYTSPDYNAPAAPATPYGAAATQPYAPQTAPVYGAAPALPNYDPAGYGATYGADTSVGYGYNTALPAFQSQASMSANAYPQPAAQPAALPQVSVYKPDFSDTKPQAATTQEPNYAYTEAAFSTNDYPPQPQQPPAYSPYGAPPQGYAPQGYGMPQQPYAPQAAPAYNGAASYGASGYAQQPYGAQPAPQAYASNSYAAPQSYGSYQQPQYQQPQSYAASQPQGYGSQGYGAPNYAATPAPTAAPAYGSSYGGIPGGGYGGASGGTYNGTGGGFTGGYAAGVSGGYGGTPTAPAAPAAPSYAPDPMQPYAAPQGYAQAPGYAAAPAPSYAASYSGQGYAQPYGAPPPQPQMTATVSSSSTSSGMVPHFAGTKEGLFGDDEEDAAAPEPGPRMRAGGFYAALRSGLSFPADTNFSDTTNGVYKNEFKLGWELGGALGYSFAPVGNNWFTPRAELEVSSHRGSIDRITVGGTKFTDPAAFGDVNTWRVFTNAYVDINTPWRRWFTPWIGGGVGAGFADFDRLGTSTTSVALSDSAVGLAWNASAGLSFPLWSGGNFDLGYRYSQVLDLDLTTVDGTKTTADLGGHEITFGLRQSFGLGGMGNVFGF